MDALDKNIGCDKKDLSPHVDDGDIIPDALDQTRMRGGHRFPDSVDKAELTNLSEFHPIL